MNRLLKDLSTIDRVQNPSSALNDRRDSEEENADEGWMNVFPPILPYVPIQLR
jgi:hypothetical protein